MLSWPIAKLLPSGSTVLALGAHADDIALGCGGLLQVLRLGGSRLHIHALVCSHARDAVRSNEEHAACDQLGVDDLQLLQHRDTLLPNSWDSIKDSLLTLRERIGIDKIGLVLTHRLEDAHQDHRVVAENTWRAFRDHLILEYEIAKYEADLGAPNLYVPLTAQQVERKLEVLWECYPSRRVHQWWRPTTMEALLRLRGLECNAEFAEAFHVRKMVCQAVPG